MWRALGILAVKLVCAACEWRLLWPEGKLLVPSDYMDDPDILDKLSDIIIGSLSIHQYSESRWLSIGRSCRSLCLCVALG